MTNKIIKIAIKVDSQMEQDIKGIQKERNLKTEEEAVFALFEMGRVSFNDMLDDRGE